MREGDEEMLAMIAQFRGMIADWRLRPAQVAALLQVDRADLGFDLIPREPEPSEHRMRLLLDIASMLSSIAGDSEPWEWVRANDVHFDDEQHVPLELMSGPLRNLRALRTVLLCYA